MEEILHGLRTVEIVAESIGLEFNQQKCELISHGLCSIG